MTDEPTQIAETIIDNLPIPQMAKTVIDFFVAFLIQEAERVFGKSVGGGVAAQNQELTNKKYQWVLDAIVMDIFPAMEKRCPSWETPEFEAVKPYVLQLVISELNKLPQS